LVPPSSAGFLILAVCPGAPFTPPLTKMAKGNVAVSIGLMALLAASSALAAPILLRVLLPMLAGNQPLKVDAAKIAVTLLSTQLVPLCGGMCVRQFRPRLADRMMQPFSRAGRFLILIALGLILAIRYPMLAAIRMRAVVGMLVLTVASIAFGWLLGEPGSSNRKAMCFSTAIRNVAVGLVIVTSSFPGTPAVTAALIYGLFQTVVLVLLAIVWGRCITEGEHYIPGIFHALVFAASALISQALELPHHWVCARTRTLLDVHRRRVRRVLYRPIDRGLDCPANSRVD